MIVRYFSATLWKWRLLKLKITPFSLRLCVLIDFSSQKFNIVWSKVVLRSPIHIKQDVTVVDSFLNDVMRLLYSYYWHGNIRNTETSQETNLLYQY